MTPAIVGAVSGPAMRSGRGRLTRPGASWTDAQQTVPGIRLATLLLCQVRTGDVSCVSTIAYCCTRICGRGGDQQTDPGICRHFTRVVPVISICPRNHALCHNGCRDRRGGARSGDSGGIGGGLSGVLPLALPTSEKVRLYLFLCRTSCCVSCPRSRHRSPSIRRRCDGPAWCRSGPGSRVETSGSGTRPCST